MEDAWHYLLQGKPEHANAHQRFLKTFTHMQWRQYSALSHGSFDGYIGETPAGAYFVLDRFPHEQRKQFEEMYNAFITRHISRAATILLALITELQLYFTFDGADINNRIQTMWATLGVFFEAKELSMSGIAR